MHWTSSLQILLRWECHHYSQEPHLEKLYKSALFRAGAVSVVRRCLRQTDGNMISVWESVFTTGNLSHPAQWASPQSYPQISCPSQLEASQRRPRGAALPRASSLHKHHQPSLCGASVYGTWPVSQGRRYQHQQTDSSPVTSQQNTGFEDEIRILICEVS